MFNGSLQSFEVELLLPVPLGEGWGEGAWLTRCSWLAKRPHPGPRPEGEGVSVIIDDATGLPRAVGFSLPELLVVIGIISLLIGLLMPAISNARERSNQVACLARLREIRSAGQLHENDHHGFMQVAGWHWNLPNGECDPDGLNDKDRRRYSWYMEEGVFRPMPLTAALAVPLGVSVGTASRVQIEEALASEQLRKLFRCPSDTTERTGWTERGGEPFWTSPDEFSSYAFNEAFLGRRDRAEDPGPMGQVSKVKVQSRVMFAMDGRPRDDNGDRWFMVPDMGVGFATYSFADYVRDSDAAVGGLGHELPDYWRHRRRMNVVFLDGHAETLPMTPASFDGIGIGIEYAR